MGLFTTERKFDKLADALESWRQKINKLYGKEFTKEQMKAVWKKHYKTKKLSKEWIKDSESDGEKLKSYLYVDMFFKQDGKWTSELDTVDRNDLYLYLMETEKKGTKKATKTKKKRTKKATKMKKSSSSMIGSLFKGVIQELIR